MKSLFFLLISSCKIDELAFWVAEYNICYEEYLHQHAHEEYQSEEVPPFQGSRHEWVDFHQRLPWQVYVQMVSPEIQILHPILDLRSDDENEIFKVKNCQQQGNTNSYPFLCFS